MRECAIRCKRENSSAQEWNFGFYQKAKNFFISSMSITSSRQSFLELIPLEVFVKFLLETEICPTREEQNWRLLYHSFIHHTMQLSTSDCERDK